MRCKNVGKGFKRKDALARHVRNMHGDASKDASPNSSSVSSHRTKSWSWVLGCNIINGGTAYRSCRLHWRLGLSDFHSWCISGILNCSSIWEPNSKQHTCNYENCGKAFDSMKDHRRHEKIQSDERNFLCNAEGRKYSSIWKDALKGHMDVHGEKNENVEVLERRARRRNCRWGRAKSNLIVPEIFGLRIRILLFRTWVSSFEKLFYCNGLWTSRTCFPNFVKIVEIRSVVSSLFYLFSLSFASCQLEFEVIYCPNWHCQWDRSSWANWAVRHV